MANFHYGYDLGITPQQVLSIAQGPEQQSKTLATAVNFIYQSGLFSQFLQDFSEQLLGKPIHTQDDFIELLKLFWPVQESDPVNTFLRDTLAFYRGENDPEGKEPGQLIHVARPMFITRDGTYFSVQAGPKFSCEPSSLMGPYTEVEILSTDFALPVPEGVSVIDEMYYGYPVAALNQFIAEHGGIDMAVMRKAHARLDQFGVDFFQAHKGSFDEFQKQERELLRQISAEIAAGTF